MLHLITPTSWSSHHQEAKARDVRKKQMAQNFQKKERCKIVEKPDVNIGLQTAHWLNLQRVCLLNSERRCSLLVWFFYVFLSSVIQYWLFSFGHHKSQVDAADCAAVSGA